MAYTDRVKSIIKTFTVEELEKMFRKHEEDELFFYVGFAALSPEDRKSKDVQKLAIRRGYDLLMSAHGVRSKFVVEDVFADIDSICEELSHRFSRWFCDRCGDLVKGEVRRHRGEAVCTDCFFGR
jgi:formylmethanofuran dehydrogenase subunit E